MQASEDRPGEKTKKISHNYFLSLKISKTK
jgi:hypothetical protein